MEGRDSPSTLMDYLRVVRRRKWVLLQAIVLVPLAAVAFSLRQPHVYQSSAEVLLSRQNLGASLNGIQDPYIYQQADRFAATQADIARVPAVAARAIARSGVTDVTPDELLADSSVSAKSNADLLEIKVKNRRPSVAARLATAYARAFTDYRRELDTGALAKARGDVGQRIAQLKANGAEHSALYASLVEKEQQLGTMQTLATSNHVVREASDGVQVQPRPVRNGILGLLLGIVLGLGLAFLREALDTRVRSADDVAHQLGLPLLGRLGEPARRLRRRKDLAMLAAPSGQNAEAFRVLRTNLEFVNLERRASTIMVTSAVEGEGKSTTIANLALALARAGRDVVLVDLDLRRPSLDRFFGLEDQAGLTDVALGHIPLDRAVAPIAFTNSPGANPNGLNGGGKSVDGFLRVLPSGPVPPAPGEFVGSGIVSELLARLAPTADIVLLDAPPLLHVGDAMTLSAKVDGLLLVTRLDRIRRPMLREVARLLDVSPATKLGVIVTGAKGDETYGYGYRYSYGGYREPARRSTEETVR